MSCRPRFPGMHVRNGLRVSDVGGILNSNTRTQERAWWQGLVEGPGRREGS